MIKNEQEYEACFCECNEGCSKIDCHMEKMKEHGYSEKEIMHMRTLNERLMQKNKQEIDKYERLCKQDLSSLQGLNPYQFLIGLRIYKEISQCQLAKMLDITEEHLKNLERNEYYGITLERYQEILQILGAYMIPTFIIGDHKDACNQQKNLVSQIENGKLIVGGILKYE